MSKPTYEELERQLAEANDNARDWKNAHDLLKENFHKLQTMLEQAESERDKLRQQVEDSRKQPHVAEVRCIFGIVAEVVLNLGGMASACMMSGKIFGPSKGDKLYAFPIIPPTVEEAVKAAKRYEFLRDEDNWGEDENGSSWAELGELHAGEFDAFVDKKMAEAAIRERGEK